MSERQPLDGPPWARVPLGARGIELVKDAGRSLCRVHRQARGRRSSEETVRHPGVRGLAEGHLDQLPLVKPGDDLLDRLVGVFVLDDLAGGLCGRVMEVAALDA